jgi:presenilin-like A22 family membrane protease
MSQDEPVQLPGKERRRWRPPVVAAGIMGVLLSPIPSLFVFPEKLTFGVSHHVGEGARGTVFVQWFDKTLYERLSAQADIEMELLFGLFYVLLAIAGGLIGVFIAWLFLRLFGRST